MKIRDSQRDACYRWQSAIFGHSVDLFDVKVKNYAHAKEIVDRISNRYDINPPVFAYSGNRSRTAGYYHRTNEIRLPKSDWGRCVSTLVHEIAHAIIYYNFSDGFGRCTVASHGPEFASLLLDLFTGSYTKFPRAKARDLGIHLPKRRVRFATAKNTPQPIDKSFRIKRHTIKWELVGSTKGYLETVRAAKKQTPAKKTTTRKRTKVAKPAPKPAVTIPVPNVPTCCPNVACKVHDHFDGDVSGNTHLTLVEETRNGKVKKTSWAWVRSCNECDGRFRIAVGSASGIAEPPTSAPFSFSVVRQQFTLDKAA